MKKKRRTIKTKIIGIILLVSIVTIAVGFSISIYNSIRNFKTEMISNTTMNARFIAEYSSAPLSFRKPENINEMLSNLQPIPYIQNVIIYDNKGNTFAKPYNRSGEDFEPPLVRPESYHHFDGEYLHIFEPIVYKSKQYGTIYMRASTENLSKKITQYIITMSVLIVGLILLSFILANRFQRLISKPILDLANTSQRISSKADYSLRVERQSNDEIGVLYDEFNNMLNQIQKRELERDRALESLRESEEKFKKIASSANDAIILLNEQSKIIFWNNAAERIFGYTLDEIINTNIFNIIASGKHREMLNERILQTTERQSETQSGKTIELKAIKKDGTEFEIEISISSIKIGGDRNAVSIIRDITERKIYEQNLKRAKQRAEESDRLKSAFLANMSHEIRTPMNAIVGFTDLINRPNLSMERREQFIKIIRKNSTQLLQLIDDILDISKIEAEQVSLNETVCIPDRLLTELYEYFEAQKSTQEKYLVELRLKKDKNIEPNLKIQIDEYRLRQILKNLIGNAIKFTSAGFVEFGYTFKNDDSLLFYVKDTGIGMSEEKQKIVFDRFRQADSSTKRKYGGTGLGLAICQGLVNLMGGKIWVESILEKGSTFYLTIPYKKPQKSVISDQIMQADFVEIPTKKKDEESQDVILIVEDEESNFELLKEALENIDAKILWAKDGKPAVELCKANENITLVLMDIQMPGLNGYEATKQIKAFRKDLPIIAQTAYSMAGEKQKVMEAGCDGYITKPIKLKELLDTVHKYIGNKKDNKN